MHDAAVPSFASRCTNLALARLGARALTASDEFFAPKERMLEAGAAVFVPGKFDDHGKWMDGWETRRKRVPGHDWCVVRLGASGRIRGVDIDTSHFTGNFPPAASLEAARLTGDPDATTVWTTVLARTTLRGDSHNFAEVSDEGVWTHVRLNIFPDGGVARLRVYGDVHCDWAALDPTGLYDLLALERGGRPLAWNDAHYSSPESLMLPGRGVDMDDGWQTRRRREPGNDWCVLALGHAGVIEKVEVDTAFYKGNFPDRCSLQAANVAGTATEALVAQSQHWPVLLPEQPLSADAVVSFVSQVARLGPITHVRFNIYPDGGVSRLRLWGRLA